MKKTFTRALSLILVLVMMIGVMPTAFASEAGELEARSFSVDKTDVSLKVDAVHQIAVTGMVSNNGTPLELGEIKATYQSDDATVASVDTDGKVTAHKVGTAKITVTGKGTRDGWDYTHVGTATVTVTVTADPTYSSEAQTVTLSVGEEKPLDPTAALSPAYSGEALTWTLSSGNDKVSVDGMKIKGLAAGTATITASTTKEGIPDVTFNVTVSEPEYVVTLDPATLDVAVGAESEEITLTINKGTGTADKDGFDIVWYSSDATVATVNSGVVTGVKVGTSEITAVVTKDGKNYTSTKCVVTVTDAVKPVIECKGAYVKPTETYTLRPVLKINDIVISDVDFKFVPSAAFVNSVVTASDKDSATITNRYGGAVEVTVSVERYKIAGSDSEVSGDDVDVEPIKVRVWFYDTNNISVTLRSGKTKITLDDEKVFSKININGSDLNAFYNDMSFSRVFEYLMEGEMGDYKGKPKMVYFENLSGYSSGQIVDTHGYALSSKEWGFLDQVWFAQSGNRTGTASFSYKIVDDEGLTIMTGTCDVIITGGEGDIHYETTSSKPITLKEVDFQNFWTEQKMGNQYMLSYVTFDVTGMSGVLYTDNTKKTVVTAGMNFYLNPARGEHDLGSVYYVPNVKDTSEYVDSFNFRVFSNYNSTNASGTVTIGVNTKAATNISSRGVVMGATHSKAIYDIYKSNSGTTLGYVVFELPEAKYGKLYSALPTSGGHTKVAEGEELKLTDKLWYDSKVAGDLPLSSLAFIPAAGFKGEVELHYTAYDAYGNNQYNGKLRFNVTTKTASGVFSDVTAKNYSWAADSADFLYYEGTAQGSNGKYNPASKITRQDFMLMLYRAFLAKDYSTFNVISNFPDVVKGTSAYTQEIYQAVGVAKYLGIAQGSNNKFNPKSNITRQEAMVLIYRTLDVINKDLEYTTTTNITAFKDYNKISSWATSAISYLVNHGVIQGSNDKINPSANITRAEMACILHRVLTY